MKTIFAIAAMAVIGSANALTIDNFTTVSSVSILSGVGIASGSANGAGILGGERDIQVQVLANPLNVKSEWEQTSGWSVGSNGLFADSVMRLQYDGADGGTFGGAGSGSNLGLGSNNIIVVPFFGSDLNVTVNVTTMTSGSVTSSVTLVHPGGAANTLSFTLSAAAAATADSLTISFDGVPSSDFAIGPITAVPEPTTMIVLGGALFGIARKRRNRA